MFGIRISAARARPFPFILRALVACVLLLTVFLSRFSDTRYSLAIRQQLSWLHRTAPAAEVPAAYLEEPVDEDWCQDRFGTKYLANARNSAVSYCTNASTTTLTCMWSHTTNGDHRNDALCYAQGTIFDPSQKKFQVDCSLREFTDEEKAAHVPKIPEDLTKYWYDTGPGIVMREAVQLNLGIPVPETTRTTILVKREGSHNTWHSLMEILSLTWTLDILHLSGQGDATDVLLRPDVGDKAQIVLLDDHEDGPYFDLWRQFAKLPIRRITELGPDEPPSNIVIPLSGGSNTLWQGDWESLPCHDSALPRAFSERTLQHYQIPEPAYREYSVAITWIRRIGTRRLIDEEAHIEALRQAMPGIPLEVVDFAVLSFPQQLEVVRRTDVLAGVHGAGLTHTMFLPTGSAVVEILPEGSNTRVFTI